MQLFFILTLCLATTDWARAAAGDCSTDEAALGSWCGNCMEANSCMGEKKVTAMCNLELGETCKVETIGGTKIASCVKTNNPKCSSACSAGKIKVCDPVDASGISRILCQGTKIGFASKCPGPDPNKAGDSTPQQVCDNGNCVVADKAGGCQDQNNANKLIPLPPNCQKYVLCDAKKKIVFSASCPNTNQYYDPEGDCQTKPYVPCRGVNIQGYVAHKVDETKYLFCNRNTLVGSPRQCAAGTPKWNDATKQCGNANTVTNAPLKGCDFGTSGN